MMQPSRFQSVPRLLNWSTQPRSRQYTGPPATGRSYVCATSCRRTAASSVYFGWYHVATYLRNLLQQVQVTWIQIEHAQKQVRYIECAIIIKTLTYMLIFVDKDSIHFITLCLRYISHVARTRNVTCFMKLLMGSKHLLFCHIVIIDPNRNIKYRNALQQ